ncbi:MAG: IclR family transcriptional regulator [Paracoccaceae bacterium]
MADSSAPTERISSGGLQSLDLALGVLAKLARGAGPMSLKDIAHACDMPPSKVHRYLASFLAAGLVSQAGRSGKYDLGLNALQLGLAAMARHDFIAAATDRMPDLRDSTGMTVLLSVWGNDGSTVIRWERAASPMVTSMGLGTVLPLLTSATGRAFFAYAPQAPLKPTLAVEAARLCAAPELAPEIDPSPEGLVDLHKSLRAAGFASVSGRFIPGLVAAAAPVLDWQGEALAVITLIGTDEADIEANAKPVKELRATCAEISADFSVTVGSSPSQR